MWYGRFRGATGGEGEVVARMRRAFPELAPLLAEGLVDDYWRPPTSPDVADLGQLEPSGRFHVQEDSQLSDPAAGANEVGS